MYVCTYVCMYVSMHVCMYVSMYVCMYVCVCVCMYNVCMYVLYMYTYIHIYICMCIHTHTLDRKFCTVLYLWRSSYEHVPLFGVLRNVRKKYSLSFNFSSELLLGPEKLNNDTKNSDNNSKWNCIYGSSVCFKWDLAHWRQNDSDMMTTSRYDTATTQQVASLIGQS